MPTHGFATCLQRLRRDGGRRITTRLGRRPSQTSRTCSDQEGDPHSPNDGGVWSHMTSGWLIFTHNGDRKAYLKRWVPDLYKDTRHAFPRRDVPADSHHAVGFALCYGFGYWLGGTPMAVVVPGLGNVRAIGHRLARDLDGQQRFAHVGLPKLSKRPTIAETIGSSRSWRTARGGTTTITPIHAWRNTATSGTSSTSLGRRFKLTESLRIGLGCRRLPHRRRKEGSRRGRQSSRLG